MSHSSLFSVAAVPTIGIPPALDPRYYVTGTLTGGAVVCHGEPGAAVPSGAIAVYYNGSASWTWMSFATAQPAIAALCVPHEWAGESTAAGITKLAFPLLP